MNYLKLLLCFVFLSALTSTQCICADEVQKEPPFDSKKFLGDGISFVEEYSPDLEQIVLKLEMPPEHRLLLKGKPFLKLYDQNYQFLKRLDITGKDLTFRLDDITLKGKECYAHMALYYCRDDEAGLCMIRESLFWIRLAEDSMRKQLHITYYLPSG